MITDVAITALGIHCPNLTKIELTWCREVTDTAIITLATHCSNLTEVTLFASAKFSDSAITALVSQCTNLTTVNLSCCSNVTDAAVTALATHGTNLTKVNLEWCIKITPIALFALKQCLPHLLVLTNLTDRYSETQVKTKPQLLQQLTQWYCKTGLTPVGNFLAEAYRPRFAELRIKRFWRDVCYNPEYKYARERLGKEFDSEGEQ
jgi:hypothetical protein